MSRRESILNIAGAPALWHATTTALRSAGYTVLEAASGSEALHLLRERLPDLVLCDVELPDMSGGDLSRRIKSEPAARAIPVIQICTAPRAAMDAPEALRGDADLCLTAPLEPKLLETVVHLTLQLRRTDAEARWERLVDSNVVGVVVVEDDRIVEANDMFRQMIGFTAADLKAAPPHLLDITPAEFHDTTRRAAAQVLSQGSSGTFEKEYLRRDGSRVSVVVGAALIDSRRKRWIALVLDISERKRVEAEREQALERERIARAQAEEATRLKDEFLANLSHELRTPMNIIIGWAHLLRNGSLGEEQKVRAAQAIERAARSQAQLIEDLLDVSRIVTGKFRMQMQDVKLGFILKSAVESQRMMASGKQISVTLKQEAAEARVRGDPDRLQQVFWNLLSNAVKFTPAGGRVEVRMQKTDSRVSVMVTDTGVGIAGDFLPHVFDRFRQADSTNTRPHTGMGLGLAIVRHVVELHGGAVRAESPGPDGGSTFTVTLPLLQPSMPEESVRSEETAAPADRGRQRRVLLVDDDADAREVTVAGLEKAGFHVQAVGTGQEALLLLDQWQPDIIVSDIGMPGMDGYEFMRLLRSRPAHRGGCVAALALTGFAGSEDAVRARATGYQGHVAKPVTPEDLATAIGNHLRSDPTAGS